MKKDELQEHIFSTYVGLRYGLAAIGAALPIVVWGVGALNGVSLQGSISAYYWAPDGVYAPSRDWFVGGLIAVAACLYLYKGFTVKENVALNLAGIFGVTVAVVPTAWNCQDDCSRFSVHGTSAVLFFLCLVYVVWFRSGDTLKLLPEVKAARFRKLYRGLGLVMLASPLTAFLLDSVLGRGKAYIFFVETAGILAFAAYWFAKSRELKKSGATGRVLRGKVQQAADDSLVPVPEDQPQPEAALAG